MSVIAWIQSNLRRAPLVIVLLLLCDVLHAQPKVDDTGVIPWLTAEENQWLQDNRVFRNAIVGNSQPFEYADERGEHSGITSDYLTIIAKHLNIEIQQVMISDGPFPMEKAMQNEQVDIVTYLPKFMPQMTLGIEFTKPIIQLPVALYGRTGAPSLDGLHSITDEVLAVQENSYPHRFLRREGSDIAYQLYRTPAASVLAVANGEADLFIHNTFSVEYYKRKLAVNNLEVVGYTDRYFNIRFGVRDELSPLIPIIEKTLVKVEERERKFIYNKWMNVQFEDKLDWKLVLILLCATVAIILIVVFIFSYWNRQLSLKVAERTDELKSSRDELRALARYLNQVREDEKRKLAREIHDELGHTLIAISIGVRRLSKYSELSAPTASPILNELKDLVKSASATSKRIMSDLRPSVLEDLGLIAAIEWLISEFELHSAIESQLYSNVSDIKLNDETATALFRIIQESLTNVAKHAKANRVEIHFEQHDDSITIGIHDDGVGFSAEQQNRMGSLGLRGMKERAIEIGGDLSIVSTQTDGTRLHIFIPINAQ